MKTMMLGKVGALVLSALVALAGAGLSACGVDAASEADGSAPGPEAEVARTLDALKGSAPAEASSSDIGSEYLAGVWGQATELALDFEYALAAPVVNGETASVDVTFTAYPLGEVFENTMDGFLTHIAQEVVADELAKAEAAAARGVEITGEYELELEEEALTEFENEAEAEAHDTIFAERFSANLEGVEKTFTRTLTLTLGRSAEGGWALDTLTEESGITDAIYGGIAEAAAEFNEKAADEMFIRIYTDAMLADAAL
jgi:hypothetical protein